MWFGLKCLYWQSGMMWDRDKKVNFVHKSLTQTMRLKSEISSGHLSECVATLRCFLSESLYNDSEKNYKIGQLEIDGA